MAVAEDKKVFGGWGTVRRNWWIWKSGKYEMGKREWWEKRRWEGWQYQTLTFRLIYFNFSRKVFFKTTNRPVTTKQQKQRQFINLILFFLYKLVYYRKKWEEKRNKLKEQMCFQFFYLHINNHSLTVFSVLFFVLLSLLVNSFLFLL